MPTYVYACTNANCGHQFEAVQSFTDDALTACPACGQRLRKVFGSVGVVFKGSGFYRNDSREKVSNGSAKNGPAGEKSGGSEPAGSGTASSDSGGSSTGKSESNSSGQSSEKPAAASTSGSSSSPAKSGAGSTSGNGSSKAKQAS